MNKKRIILFVLDGFGVGESEDAQKYGDAGSNTFEHVFNAEKPVLPNLSKLGVKNIDGLNLQKETNVLGNFGKLREKSAGKDSTTGHFEMMGIVSKKPMPTYPNGFPSEIVERLEKSFGTKIIGNKVASGTEIIKQFGDEHIKTGYPIVYTSADSVLQIATHKDVVSIDKLYDYCQKARDIMVGENAVGRVIARPFEGRYPFERINDKRKDFSIIPDKNNTMQRLFDNKIPVYAVGKIGELFSFKAITKSFAMHNNIDAMNVSKQLLSEQNFGFLFVNFVDTDMLFGHRNNTNGYAKCLENIDSFLGEFIDNMQDDDILIVTGDHGNDPTTPSTDHSREFVPVLIFGKNLPNGINMGTLDGFYQIGSFIEEYLLKNQKSIIGDRLWRN